MKKLTADQSKLVQDNHNLIYSFAHKYHLDLDEWYDVLALGLCKAALQYDSERSAFSTYAYCCMRAGYLQEVRKSQAVSRFSESEIVSYNQLIDIPDGCAELISVIKDLRSEGFTSAVEYKLDAISAYESLSDRDKLIVELRIGQGMKQKDVAEAVRVKQPTVAKIVKKFRESIK